MKPETESLKTLQYTQSTAKTIEFEVPQQMRERIEARFSHKPEDIFDIVIALLGEISNVYRNPKSSEDDIKNEEEKLRFCAEFLDNYKSTERLTLLNDYCLLIGSAAYYLSNLPGSSQVLIRSINYDSLNLDGDGLENLLYCLLAEKTLKTENFHKSKYIDFLKRISNTVETFNKSGVDYGLVKISNALEDFAFKIGTDREIFLSDIIFSILYKKKLISAWILLPNYSELSLDIWKSYLSTEKSIKTLWPAQILLGQANVYKGASCVIQLPTSSGKTKSTELIIRSSFLSGRTNIAVVIAPFKALCHEIKRDYRKAFKSENINIDEINDILTQDDLNEFIIKEDKKTIIILTPEKFYYLIHFDFSFIQNIGLIILDEGHQFDSDERGITYELLITFLNQHLPETSQKVLISAVMSNATQISSWLNKNENVISGNSFLPTKRNIGFFDKEFKGHLKFVDYLTPHQTSYFVPFIFDVVNLPLRKREKKARFFPDLTDSKSVALYLSIKMSQKGITAIFCGTKVSANAILKIIPDIYERLPDYKMPILYSDRLEIEKLKKMILQNLGSESNLYKASQYGFFSHHLDVPLGIKSCIEYGLQKEKIKCVICTSTLAQGVNLPIKYLFIPNTNQGTDFISVRDFQNLIGRVARAGKITDGCIIFTKEDSFYNTHNFDLLDATKSEKCMSSLLKIINEPNPFYQFSNIQDLVDFYLGKFDADEVIKRYLGDDYEKIDDASKDILKKEFLKKLKYISSIENFFMLLGDELNAENVKIFIKNTLAYNLLNEDKKGYLLYILGEIANNVYETLPPERRITLAKTMQGLKVSLGLSKFFDENCDNLLHCSTSIELLEQFWPYLIKNNVVYQFSFVENKGLLLESIKKWISGTSYYELWNILKNQENGKNTRFTKNIESVVNFFDSGINYNCCVTVNALAELIGDRDEHTTNMLKLLQRQLKYGLPTNKLICIYELGFCDRCLVQELEQFVDEEIDIDLIKFDLLKSKDSVLEVLSKYPSYFETVFERLSY